MDQLLTRHSSQLAHELLATFPAVIIEGARQAGKSTFAQQLVDGRAARVLTLDDDDVRAAALEDPGRSSSSFRPGLWSSTNCSVHPASRSPSRRPSIGNGRPAAFCSRVRVTCSASAAPRRASPAAR